jgi:hypothetical protein
LSAVAEADEGSSMLVYRSIGKETIMGTGYLEAKQAIQEMLRSHEVLTMEDILNATPEFSWAQLFLAIDLLSREGAIALYRQGLSYEIRLVDQLWDVDHQPFNSATGSS